MTSKNVQITLFANDVLLMTKVHEDMEKIWMHWEKQWRNDASRSMHWGKMKVMKISKKVKAAE